MIDASERFAGVSIFEIQRYAVRWDTQQVQNRLFARLQDMARVIPLRHEDARNLQGYLRNTTYVRNAIRDLLREAEPSWNWSQVANFVFDELLMDWTGKPAKEFSRWLSA